jgi:hypothetical protein
MVNTTVYFNQQVTKFPGQQSRKIYSLLAICCVLQGLFSGVLAMGLPETGSLEPLQVKKHISGKMPDTSPYFELSGSENNPMQQDGYYKLQEQPINIELQDKNDDIDNADFY